MTKEEKMRRITLALLLVAAGFFVGVVALAVPPPPETCIPAQVLVPDERLGVLVVIGDRQICGRGLYMTGVTGPSVLGSSRLPLH